MAPKKAVKDASPPFGKNFDAADIILRSSDGEDFYAHKLVLSLASPFFKDMFSMPQPTSTPLGTSDHTQPVIDMAEDSAVIDCLLRYCYPVFDPVINNLDLVEKIIGATMKYDLTEASVLVTQALQGFSLNDPFRVFSIACEHKLEETALSAAMWCRSRATFGVGPPTQDFASTVAGRVYSPYMTRRISAGCYLRLIKYAVSQLQNFTKFCHVPPAQTNFDVKKSSSAYPFNSRSADLVLQSSDGFDFAIHRAVLLLNLGQDTDEPLEQKLEGMSYTPGTGGQLPTVTLPEDGQTLATLLQLIYPSRDDCSDISEWDVEKLGSGIAIRAIRAAQRRGFAPIERTYKARLRRLTSEEPLRAYCIAATFGWMDIAQAAAKQLVFTDIHLAYCIEMEEMHAEHYYRLLQYHHRCHQALRDTVMAQFPPSANRVGSHPPRRSQWLLVPDASQNPSTFNAVWPALLEDQLDKARANGQSSAQLDWAKVAEIVRTASAAVEATLQPVSVCYHMDHYPFTKVHDHDVRSSSQVEFVYATTCRPFSQSLDGSGIEQGKFCRI